MAYAGILYFSIVYLGIVYVGSVCFGIDYFGSLYFGIVHLAMDWAVGPSPPVAIPSPPQVVPHLLHSAAVVAALLVAVLVGPVTPAQLVPAHFVLWLPAAFVCAETCSSSYNLFAQKYVVAHTVCLRNNM